MKNRAIWLLIPVVGLGLAACKKQETAAAPEPSAATTTPTTAPETQPPAPAMDADARAEKLGFAKHLPADIEVLLSVYNGSQMTEDVTSSKLWELVRAQMGLGGPIADPDPAAPGEPTGPAALFATEFTLASGATTKDQLANLLTLNNRSTHFQMKALAKALATAIQSGEGDALGAAAGNQFDEEMILELMQDPQSGIGIIEKLGMPPLYLAFHTTDDQRPGAEQQLASMVQYLGMMEGMIEPVEIEKPGAKFAGYKVLGAKIVEMMEQDRAGMEEAIGTENADRLIKAIAPKNLVAVSGTVGEYVVLFFGPSEDALVLAESPASSLGATGKLAFFDPYASKNLAAVAYGDDALIQTALENAGGMTDIANGIRDGLAESGGLGDTRDIESLLQLVGERESALRKLASHQDAGKVAFFEQGLKIESFGGLDSGSVDWQSPNKLAPLGNGEDVFMFANMTADATSDAASRAYLEVLVETAYALASKVAEAPATDGELGEFKQMAELFETKFRPDVVALWDAMSGDFADGLGAESAMVVDLNGSFPTVPGISQEIADEAKFPRISLISLVTDRAKIASSWQQVNASATNILAKISEISGNEIPMQKPLSSERDGNTTWFFSMPFFNDDFVPSVTIGDHWFAASTSKNQALDLIAAADAGGETRTGLWFEMDFNVLRKFSVETLDVVQKNSESLFGGNSNDEQIEQIREVIDALENLDEMTVHSRRENGQLRSSVHFKTH